MPGFEVAAAAGVASRPMGRAPRLPVAGVDRFIAAPPGDLWGLLVDLQAWPLWGPSVQGADLVDGATMLSAGSRGTVRTVGGARLPFRVTRWQDGRRWDWMVAGVPATGHEVVTEDGGCRVRFEVPWWAVAYLPVCAVALRRLEKLATARH